MMERIEKEVPKEPVTGGGQEGQVQLLVTAEQQPKRKDEKVRGHTVLYYWDVLWMSPT